MNIATEQKGEEVLWQTKNRSRKRKVVIQGKATGRDHMTADVRHIEVFISRLNPATTAEDVENLAEASAVSDNVMKYKAQQLKTQYDTYASYGTNYYK